MSDHVAHYSFGLEMHIEFWRKHALLLEATTCHHSSLLHRNLANLLLETKAPGIFGVPLRQSITYANVAISLIDESGQSYIYGYVPIVVAKCGVFLKEKGEPNLGCFLVDKPRAALTTHDLQPPASKASSALAAPRNV